MPELQSNGATIHYFVEGEGPLVLLIQGAGVVGEGWRPQVRGLARQFTLVAFDNRGIGRSRAPAGPLTIEQMARDALAVLDALGAPAVHLVGHSMGGLIAQELALGSPQRVMSLALLCTFAHGSQGARLTPAMALTALRMRVGTRAMRRRAFTELVMPADYLREVDRARLAEDLRPLFGRDLAEQPSIVMKQVRAMARYDAFPRLGALSSTPTLVLAATHDRIALPAFNRELAAAIPGARYVEIAEAGHGVTIQCADRVNGELTRHWRGRRGGWNGGKEDPSPP